MKKMFVRIAVLMVVMLTMILVMNVVGVYADTGLNSTWYQVEGAKEGDLESLKFSQYLGAADSSKNWDATNEEFFSHMKEVGKMKVKDFLIPTKEDGDDFLVNAESLGVIMPGVEWEPEYVAIKYEGYIMAEADGTYQFFSSFIDNGFVCFINEEKIFEFWGPEMWMDSGREGTETGKEFALEAFKPVKFEAYYIEEHGGEVIDMEVKVNGADKTFAGAKLHLFTDVPTEEELDKVKNPPTPVPTTPAPATATPEPKTATPKPSETVTQAATGNTQNSAEDNGNNDMLLIVGGAILAVLVIGGIVFMIVKKKKK